MKAFMSILFFISRTFNPGLEAGSLGQILRLMPALRLMSEIVLMLSSFFYSIEAHC